MFDKMKGMMNQVQMMQKLMQNEDFKAFISNPKVRQVFMDPEFRQIVKSNDFAKLAANPKFASLMQDPEIRTLIERLRASNFKL